MFNTLHCILPIEFLSRRNNNCRIFPQPCMINVAVAEKRGGGELQGVRKPIVKTNNNNSFDIM